MNSVTTMLLTLQPLKLDTQDGQLQKWQDKQIAINACILLSLVPTAYGFPHAVIDSLMLPDVLTFSTARSNTKGAPKGH
jgi:hypothetical protein